MKSFIKLLSISTIIASTPAFAQEHHGHSHGGHSHSASSSRTGINLGGVIDFQAAFRDHDLKHGSFSRENVFKNDTEVHVTVNQVADNGLRYGAVIQLEADVTEADKEEGLNADKTYLYLESNYGRLELGSNSDAAHALGVDASTFARATGGIHGDLENYINMPHGHGHGHGHSHDFVLSPTLPLAHNHGESEDATKITYYTPRTSGFQFGASFIPDSGNVGTAAGFTSDADEHQFSNVMNVALQHSGKIGEVGTLASISGEFGNAETAEDEDLAAGSLGLNVNYQGITVGGNYSYWGDSMTEVTDAVGDGYSWSLGAGYATGPIGVSLGYLNGELKDNTSEIISLGADYKLAPGLVPYAELSFFNFDAVDQTWEDTDGTLFILGTTLVF